MTRECPECGKEYPEEFSFCPVDGASLAGGPPGGGPSGGGPSGGGPSGGGAPKGGPRRPAQIRVRTLMTGFAVLVLLGLIAFTAAFLYQYWKPKFGGLTVKTTPVGALVSIDGKVRGTSPLSIGNLPSGGHQVGVRLEGYREQTRQVMVIPYATESVHWELEPVVPRLSNEQLAEIEALGRKLDGALKDNILLPPPEDYNVLYFVDRILEIDPANKDAADTRARLADTFRRRAELAYAREDWLESEKQYKNLLLLFPEDGAIGERLEEIAARLDARVQDREEQIARWRARAEAAMKVGSLLPPDRDNALDAIRSIQRLDPNNGYIREAIAHLKELMQNRGDAKIAASDWAGARADFRAMLQYFPEDTYSRARLETVESRLAEAAQTERQKSEEKESRARVGALRQSALQSFRAGAYEKSIAEWGEYLKSEPASDEAYFYIGASHQNRKQLDTAILNFEKSLQLNPRNVLAHLNLGLLYDYHRNDLGRAEAHLVRARELGGADQYTPERLLSMIQDLRDRDRAAAVMKHSYPVEHRHAFSSCRGNLHFSEQGMEYRTSETDHSFYESYREMRHFAIEGDQMSVRTRDNRKYNFRFLNAGDSERIRAWISSTRQIIVGGKVE